MQLTGSALVTGGGSGIGLACATRLAADGAAVTLMGRSGERLEVGRARLLEAVPSARVSVAAGDVAEEGAVEAAVATATAAGPLRHVVAAAGVGAAGPLTDQDVDAWERVLAVNLTGAMLTVKHAARSMVAHGDGGSIVAISSIAGGLTHRLMTAYCVSKAGLEMLVRNAADELGAHGIRVNAVRPGLVPTEIADGLVSNEGIVADYLAQMPISRLGATDDIAEGVRYLAGPESGWVTGQILAIDGGHTLRRGPDLLAGRSP
ncbi:MAG: SDR family oxidoreductase [Actinomycetota bacterium]